MIKVLGFIMFWIGVGMIIGLLIENVFIGSLIIVLLMLLGYNLFCGKCG